MRRKFSDLPESVQAAEVGARGQVRAAGIAAVATLLGGVIGPVAGLLLGLLQYTGPGGSTPSTVALPPETRTVTVTPDLPPGASTPSPPAGATYLVDTQPVVGSADYATGIATVNTDAYSRSVMAYASCRVERKVEFPLDRKFTEFTAMIGPSDESESGATVAFAALVDKRRIDPVMVEVGSSEEFTVDVTNGFRLTLIYISSEFSDGSCPSPAVAVWGDARLT